MLPVETEYFLQYSAVLSRHCSETDRDSSPIAETPAPETKEEVDDGAGDAIGSVEDVAALAIAAQPTGFTFATTNVHTKVGLSLSAASCALWCG